MIKRLGFIALIIMMSLSEKHCTKPCAHCYLVENDNMGNLIGQTPMAEYCGDILHLVNSVGMVKTKNGTVIHYECEY
jgi:hypothetical protein